MAEADGGRIGNAERAAPTVRTGALLERDRELAVLEEAVRGAAAGRAALVVVEGPAGIGKSRLLGAVRAQAAGAGFRVLSARGSGLERELPFGMVRQLFEPVMVAQDQRHRWLAGSATPAARVFEPPDEARVAGDSSFGILYGLFWLVANMAADGPVLLTIDDLHWCDPASLRFIAYLEHRLEGLPVLVVGALRTGEPPVDTTLLTEVVEDPAAMGIRPHALSKAAAGQLVRERLGPGAEEAFWTACHRATGGNPLLLLELLKALEAEGVTPDAAHVDVIREMGARTVSRMVLLRLSRLATDAVAVARAIAVLGDGASLPSIAGLAELDEQRAVEAIRALVQGEILRPDAPLGFVHPLVRDAVYRDVAPAERELCHERAAQVLTDLGAAPELVATHLLAVPCRGRGRVVDLLRAAAQAAARRGDADSAASYLRRALAEPPPQDTRPRLLLELGLAEHGFDAVAAAGHLSDAYDRLANPRHRAVAARILSRVLLFTGPAQAAVAVAQRAVAELPSELADERRALEAFELYGVALGARVPDAPGRLARARAAGVADGPGGKVLSAVAAWGWAMDGGPAADCTTLALAALADGSLVSANPGFGAVIAGATLGLADRDEAPGVWDAAMAEARRLGSLRAICLISIWRGFTWLQRGELAEAEDVLGEALEQIRSLEQNGAGTAYIVAFLARVLIEQGDLAGARRVLAGGGNPAPASDGDGLLRRSEIEVLLGESHWEQALAQSDNYRSRLRGIDNPAWGPWRSLRALALDGMGHHDEAVTLLEQELALARRWGAPGALGRVLRLLGTLHRDGGVPLLQEAVEVTDRPAVRLEHGKALVALGSALRRAGRRADAREPLRRGLDITHARGARAVAEYARSELAASGVRPRREASAGPESLTPSERRIAELAAAGPTNRDIAQALYVTPKTVEVHLTSVFRKLGISARSGLREALGGTR
jgi:DNA-binding CsgD family transcriptional regulator